MAISRAQIPEQIDAYQEGGDVLGSDDRQQPSMQELSDFDKSVREYEQRFQGLTPRPAPMN